MTTDQLPIEPSGLLHRDDGYYTWTKGREPERKHGGTFYIPFFTEADVRAAIAADRARAVPVELERNVQPSINLSVQMPKIELQDPELDATDPHTRLLLLAEYWKREAMRHKDLADTQREELLRTWHVLHTFGAHPGRTDDRLADCVRNALMARPPAPEQPADLSGQAATVAGEREAFEAHMSDGGKWPKAVERNSCGEYLLASAASGWSTWQAAWAAARASLSTPASGEGWKLVDVDGQPPCNGVSVFIGINSAGYVGAFNHVRQDGMCMMGTPEGSTVVMSVLKWWRPLPPAPTSPTEPAASSHANPSVATAGPGDQSHANPASAEPAAEGDAA